MNALQTLYVTKVNGQWAFDDPSKELVREAFVAGADDLCDYFGHLVGSPEAITITFSEYEFPGNMLRMDWLREEMSGNTYRIAKFGNAEAWLCPALLKYFAKPPKQIYVKAIKPN